MPVCVPVTLPSTVVTMSALENSALNEIPALPLVNMPADELAADSTSPSARIFTIVPAVTLAPAATVVCDTDSARVTASDTANSATPGSGSGKSRAVSVSSSAFAFASDVIFTEVPAVMTTFAPTSTVEVASACA